MKKPKTTISIKLDLRGFKDQTCVLFHQNNQNCKYNLIAPTGVNVTIVFRRVSLDFTPECFDSLTVTVPVIRTNFGELVLCGTTPTANRDSVTTFNGELGITFLTDANSGAGGSDGFWIEYFFDLPTFEIGDVILLHHNETEGPEILGPELFTIIPEIERVSVLGLVSSLAGGVMRV